MSRAIVLPAILAALALALGSAFAQAGPFLDGRWEGTIDLGEGAEPLALRLFRDGGLVDLPARRLFGFPMGSLERSGEGLIFSLLGRAPIARDFALRGSPDPEERGKGLSVSGLASLVPPGGEADPEAARGAFSLSYTAGASRGPGLGLDYPVRTSLGTLPGSLLLPAEPMEGAVPVVLILAGAGEDRDGNNYSVPGRSDALADLAIALRERGVASLRYDRRGAGEAYALAVGDEDPAVDDHAEDARSAISALSDDPRFSALSIVGYGEGALVGVSALEASHAIEGGGADRLAGIATLCASGRTDLEIVEEALASIPDGKKLEAGEIMAALRKGESYPEPSPYFAGYFRPSYQPYLASLFRYDIRAALASAMRSVLVIAGGSDLQVSLGEAELLASAREGADFRVIPGMSHALKEVGDDEEANYSSFTDPDLPLADGLADLVAAFAKGEVLPGEDPRVSMPDELAGPEIEIREPESPRLPEPDL